MVRFVQVGANSAGEKITQMTLSELELVYQLEIDSQQQPWTRQHFIEELNNKVASIDLYWCDSYLAGYLCSWFIAKELQIQNLAIVPSMRRRGIAARLVDHVIQRAESTGLEIACLEVRVSNQAAIELYTRYGFVESGQRCGYYPDGEDALLMEYLVADR